MPAAERTTVRVVKRKPKKAIKRVEAPKDTKGASEFARAEAHKQTPAYRKAVRVAYDANPPEVRRKRAVRARQAPSTPDTREVLKVASDRAARKIAIRKSAATKDTKGDFERGRGRTESDLNIVRGRLEKWAESHHGVETPGRIAAQAKKELEGRGEFAKIMAKLGERALKGSDSSPGRIATKMGLGGKADIGARAAEDLANLPAQVVPSLYVPVAGVVEAAQGKPERIKKFAKDIQEGDPLYKLGEAGVALVKGDTAKAGRSFKKAKELAAEHPGFTAAEALGARGSVGRGAGRVMRSGVVGKKAKRAASTERPSRVVPGTKIEEKRAYSPDVITKREQKVVEKARRDSAESLREKARLTKDADERDALLNRAAKKDPDRLPEHEIERRVDDRVDANETVRRAHRAEAVNKARKVVRKVKGKQRSLVNLVAQGIVRADADDIRAYVKDLEAEFDSLSPTGKRANKLLRRKITAALESGKLDLGKIESAAKEYSATVRPLEDHLVKHGLLDAEQAEKARLIPYAVRRMGAKHEKDANGMSRIVIERKGPKADTEARAAELERLADSVERSAKEQEASGTYKFGVANAKHAPRLAREYRAEAARLRKGGGDSELLTVEEIRAHMKEGHDDIDPAFLSQSPNARGARNYYITSNRPPSAGTAKRTGEATRKGTFDAHPDTLTEQAARAQGLVDAHTGFGGFVDEFALRSKSGKVRGFTTKAAALKAARNRMVDENGDPIHGAHEFVAVRMNPFGGSKGQLAHLLDDVNADSMTQMSHEAILGAIDDALKGKGPDEGMWALVPKAAADRLAEHMRVLKPGTAGKVGQALNSAFRRTVLATSPAWFTGNVVEGTVRAALAKAGPRSWLTADKALKALPEAERAEAIARMLPGGHFGSAERQHVHRDVSQFEGKRIEPIVRGLSTFFRAPGPKQAAQAWHAWTTFVFHSVNGGIESQIQKAMLGAELRRSPLMADAGMKLSAKAIQQAAEGLRNTNEQVAFGRAVDTMYGKYGKYSPDMRKAIALYTPFVAWTLNATRFILQTLPRDHPTTLAVIAASEQATEEWRKEHGLDKFIEGGVPAWLQGSVPGKGGSHFRAPARFTPFGIGGDPLGSIAGVVLPQAQGVLSAMKGFDWKGKDLEDKGDFGKAAAAVKTALEATVPVLSTGQRLAEKGPKDFVADAVTGKVEPPKKRARRSAGKAGRIQGPGVGGGKIVGPGVASPKIVR